MEPIIALLALVLLAVSYFAVVRALRWLVRGAIAPLLGAAGRAIEGEVGPGAAAIRKSVLEPAKPFLVFGAQLLLLYWACVLAYDFWTTPRPPLSAKAWGRIENGIVVFLAVLAFFGIKAAWSRYKRNLNLLKDPHGTVRPAGGPEGPTVG